MSTVLFWLLHYDKINDKLTPFVNRNIIFLLQKLTWAIVSFIEFDRLEIWSLVFLSRWEILKPTL